jgi:hypothetical protein
VVVVQEHTLEVLEDTLEEVQEAVAELLVITELAGEQDKVMMVKAVEAALVVQELL